MKRLKTQAIVSLALAFSLTDFAKAYKHSVLLHMTVSKFTALKNKIASTVRGGNFGTALQNRESSQQKAEDRHYQCFIPWLESLKLMSLDRVNRE